MTKNQGDAKIDGFTVDTSFVNERRMHGGSAVAEEDGVVQPCATFTRLRTSRLLFRLLNLLFCVATVFLIVTNKQTTTVQFPGGFAFADTATFTSSDALVYLVVAMATGAAYTFIHIVDFIIIHRGKDAPICNLSMAWLVFIMDQALAYTILGAVAASSELAYLGKHGFEDAGWIKVCSYFSKYCNQMDVAIAIAYLATLCLAISSVFSALGLFSRYK